MHDDEMNIQDRIDVLNLTLIRTRFQLFRAPWYRRPRLHWHIHRLKARIYQLELRQ
jgi:hypothetical protein